MRRFSPIDPALVRKTPESFGSSKYRNIGRRSINYFEDLDKIHETDYFANTWGYTMVRTDYSTPDEKFSRAVKLLNTYAGNWLFDDLNQDQHRHHRDPPLDPRVMYEVRSRCYNVVVEDQATLNGATVEEVGLQFDEWVENHQDDTRSCFSPRLWYCIMLDKESIDNILTLPEQPDQVQFPDIYYVWVKVVTNEVQDGQRRWLRIGVYDVLWEHWFMVTETEIGFEEMVGDYPEGGVINLYGPPRSLPRIIRFERSPTPTDPWSGHPPRKLAGFPYTRLGP